MPTWGEVLLEIKSATSLPPGVSAFDFVRRKYLAALAAHTGNDVIAYTTAWTQTGGGGPASSINVEDVQGFMEVVHGLKSDRLDLILHSPGGSPEATEAIVDYLRQKFTRVRVLVPQAAMSAATMLACASNEIVLARHSSIGPIDPQMVVRVEGNVVTVPAAAIAAQFRQAQTECAADPSKLPLWIPILKQYGPALLAQCRFAEQLSESLVAEWLRDYMFAGDDQADVKGKEIAGKLADHGEFKTHGRFISRDKAKTLGLKISDLEADQTLQDLVLSAFHAATITFSATPTVKIVENHNGKAFIKSERLPPAPQPAQSPANTPKPKASAKRNPAKRPPKKRKRRK